MSKGLNPASAISIKDRLLVEGNLVQLQHVQHLLTDQLRALR